MKATELMIDDWVRISNSGLHKVNSIYLTDQFVHVQKSGNVDGDVEDVRPIPLTTKILKKNNFSRFRIWGRDEWRFSCGNVLIMFIKEGDKNIGGFHLTICVDGGDNQDLDFALDMRCYYVHQLQHAMRLANIEKEVVL